jgi:hypothetical protein
MSTQTASLPTVESDQQKLRAYRISGMAQALPGRLIQAGQATATTWNSSTRYWTTRWTSGATPCGTALQVIAHARQQTIDEFDFGFNPTIPKRRILELSSSDLSHRPATSC